MLRRKRNIKISLYYCLSLLQSIQTIKSYNIVSEFGMLVITWYNRPQFFVITCYNKSANVVTWYNLSLRGIT